MNRRQIVGSASYTRFGCFRFILHTLIHDTTFRKTIYALDKNLSVGYHIKTWANQTGVVMDQVLLVLDVIFNIVGYFLGALGLIFGVVTSCQSAFVKEDKLADLAEYTFLILAGYVLIHLL